MTLKSTHLLKGKQVAEKMLNQDAFSKLLGIEIISISENCSQLSLIVNETMVNGFGIAHGAITYALADTALAFASNSSGTKSVSIETQISHISKVLKGDNLIANASLIKENGTLGWYTVEIINQNKKIVAHFKGTVFKSKNIWE